MRLADSSRTVVWREGPSVGPLPFPDHRFSGGTNATVTLRGV
jgi:hypothetical protein